LPIDTIDIMYYYIPVVSINAYWSYKIEEWSIEQGVINFKPDEE